MSENLERLKRASGLRVATKLEVRLRRRKRYTWEMISGFLVIADVDRFGSAVIGQQGERATSGNVLREERKRIVGKLGFTRT